MNASEKRILALDLHASAFGYAVLEGPERLLDWGARSFRGGVNAVQVPMREKVLGLLEEFAPSVIVLQEFPERADKKSGKRRRALGTVHAAAEKLDISLRILSRRRVKNAFSATERLTKYQIASLVSARFAELAPTLPPKRKRWQSEDYRMCIFDAVALGVAYFSALARLSNDPEHTP